MATRGATRGSLHPLGTHHRPTHAPIATTTLRNGAIPGGGMLGSVHRASSGAVERSEEEIDAADTTNDLTSKSYTWSLPWRTPQRPRSRPKDRW